VNGGFVEKRTFEFDGIFTTAAGATIPGVRAGYETAGTLNAEKSNAILIPHPNLASSHFAGRYRADDALPGYWDALVGSGRPLDTDRYFLVSVDALCNPNAYDGVTVTTGPSSIDPAKGRPYGLAFPAIGVRDLVNLQRALLAHLGIEKLHAVVGASFGGMQTFEWAIAYPKMVDRIVPVVSTPWVGAYALAKLRELRAAVMLDPNWNGGDYYGGAPPRDGIAMALRLLFGCALTPDGAEAAYGRRWADPARDPAASPENGFAVTAWLDALAAARAPFIDANNFLYTQRANELFAIDVERVKARSLLVAAKGDEILPSSYTRKAYESLLAGGTEASYVEISGQMGHYDGIYSIAQAGDAIAGFLAR
jgi:homoserine O-acetyltransferase/O-succinyltransferase